MFSKFLSLMLATLIYSQLAVAADYSIFEVHKSLPMQNNEVAYKDYYINAGNESGLKKGMYLTVVRNSAIQDPAKNVTQGTLKIPVAKMQIIQVDKRISVGRLFNQTSDDERATLEFEGVMVGDVLDMESASMEAPILKAKRKTASLDDDADLYLIKSKASPVVQVTGPQSASTAAISAPAPVQIAAPAAQTQTITTATQLPAKASPEIVKQAVPRSAPQAQEKVQNSNKPNENIL
jgi:hypothetical protein